MNGNSFFKWNKGKITRFLSEIKVFDILEFLASFYIYLLHCTTILHVRLVVCNAHSMDKCMDLIVRCSVTTWFYFKSIKPVPYVRQITVHFVINMKNLYWQQFFLVAYTYEHVIAKQWCYIVVTFNTTEKSRDTPLTESSVCENKTERLIVNALTRMTVGEPNLTLFNNRNNSVLYKQIIYQWAIRGSSTKTNDTYVCNVTF